MVNKDLAQRRAWTECAAQPNPSRVPPDRRGAGERVVRPLNLAVAPNVRA